MSNNLPDTKIKATWSDKIKSKFYPLPAYHATFIWLNSAKEAMKKDPFALQVSSIFSNEMSTDINKNLRLIELEKELVSIVESTDNKVFYRPLFFPSIFINNEFTFENLKIKGIFITECYSPPDTPEYCLHHTNPNDYCIFALAIDPVQVCEFFICIGFIKNVIGHQIENNKEENAMILRMRDFVRNIICNVIDMVEGNKEELIVTEIKTSIEQNLKRIKREQIPIPTKVFIRTKGEFKKYVNDFNSIQKNSMSHKVLVRGFWRHLLSEIFKNKQGQKIWIKPHFRGKGILISKEYMVIK